MKNFLPQIGLHERQKTLLVPDQRAKTPYAGRAMPVAQCVHGRTGFAMDTEGPRRKPPWFPLADRFALPFPSFFRPAIRGICFSIFVHVMFLSYLDGDGQILHLETLIISVYILF